MIEWIIFVVLAFILIALILIEEKQGQIVELLKENDLRERLRDREKRQLPNETD